MGSSIAALMVISVLLTAVVVMFRANQIGATLMANATRANAERVTDVANTRFEISSVSTTTEWYSQAEATPPGYGCKPIVSGIERTGEVTVADPYQCYWFVGQSGETATFQISRVFEGEKFGSPRTNTNNRLSFEFFPPGSDPTGVNAGCYDCAHWADIDSPTSFHEKTIHLQTTGTYRIKMWQYTPSLPFSSRDHGTYYILLSTGNNPPSTSVSCVESFQITNEGSKSFSDLTGMDVIASIGTTTMTRLTETVSAIPGPNEWSMSLPATTTVDGIVINNDFYEKGILNTGELLDLRIKVAGYTSESGTMTVVFPNGVSSTKSFDVLCNN